ncbi:CoA-binding protein [Tumebacillus algifaecis]|uniref:CoA-binding protein n=1 Tax=Tumebacillus algifaecis TaxID=1214604 RepID=A0A223CZZ9_9BACL|nr:CoA-binding protein [Tumebacillus algifaecis]ASS75079.1 CoA-binding protein [Tumebacillus algifaecis]
MFQNPTDQQLVDLLQNSKTIAVVGLSGDPEKASYQVAAYEQSQGYEVVPINPTVESVLGRKAQHILTEVEGPIDIVNVFRRSGEVATIVDQAIEIGAKAVWTQLDIVDETAAKKAQDAGLVVVMDKCLKVEHRRLLGKENNDSK